MDRSVFHVYNRGSRKEKVFFSPMDYSFFYGLLDKWLPYFNLRLLGYSFMPNHIHIEPDRVDKSTLSGFMHRIGTIYGMYFRTAHDLCGHVFQSRYQHKVMPRDIDVVNLSRYIHQNPVGLYRSKNWSDRVRFMRSYEWSSYKYYFSGSRPKWLNTNRLLEYFSGSLRGFREFTEYPIKKWEKSLLEKSLQ